MAHPKRKKSKASSRSRRAVYYGRLSKPTMMECSNCGNVKLRHRACPSCGHYRGKRVIDTPEYT